MSLPERSSPPRAESPPALTNPPTLPHISSLPPALSPPGSPSLASPSVGSPPTTTPKHHSYLSPRLSPKLVAPTFQRLRSFASSKMSSQVDLEKTMVEDPSRAEHARTVSPEQNDISIAVPAVAAPTLNNAQHGEDPLAKFRHFVGIHNDPSLITKRVVPNAGIYPRVVQQEKMHRRNYNIFAWLINGALGLQIVFAAALTALGAGNGPHSAITAFGAMNTIIAGFLTFLKGSGLPNRFKYYENEMMKLREHIEQREREFARGALHHSFLTEEVSRIEEMYDSVRRDIEANTPDNFISQTKLAQGTSTTAATSGFSSQFGSMKNRFDQMRHGFEERKHDLEADLQHRRTGLQDQYNSSRRDLERTRDEYTNTANQTVSGARRDLEFKLGSTRSGIDDQITGVRRGVDAEIQGLNNRVELERQGLEHRLDDEKKVMEARVSGVETKVQDTEEKALAMAEKIAEKVLGMAQKRREEKQ